MEKTKLLPPLAPAPNAKDYIRSVFRGERKYLGICFILPAIIMWVIYICMQVFPFGEESVLVLDLNGQYVYFFEELKNIIYGDGSLLYSFSRALGGEFFGIFAYYLSSPFSFIVALFPAAYMTEALLIMFLLKTGCCGLTFGMYIDATRKKDPVATVLFSSMYALCGYAVVMQHNTMWIDNLILLPIIMLGIERLIKFGRYKMFVISLSMAIFSNFYIGYMTCIFVAAYFFYYYFATSPEERNPRGEKKHFVKSFGRIGIFSVIVILICAALLLCTYYSLTFGKTEFTNPDYTFTQKFDWADMLTKFYFGSYDTVRPEGLPWLYIGMLALVLFPLYFFAPHIKTREKVASGILIAFFLFSFNASTVDMFWHGMQKPNWLNYRYSFMLCFFLILLAYKAFERITEIGYRKVIASSAVIAGTLIILQKMEYEHLKELTCVWCSLLIVAIYLGVLRASTMKDIEVRRTASLVLVILCSLELFCAGLLNVVALDEDVIFSSRSSYQNFSNRVTPVVEEIKKTDTSFYRMEKTVHRKTNDPYLLDMNGLSGSTSTLNQETIVLLKNMGLSSKAHWSKYLGGTPVLDTLFGIKYLICENDDPQPLYEYQFSRNGDLAAFKNPYALSIAYGVNNSLASLDINAEGIYSPFNKMNAIVTAMLGSEETIQVFKPEKNVVKTTNNAVHSSIAEHDKYVPSVDGASGAVYNITITDTDTLYCYFPSDYTRETELYLNGEKFGTYYQNESYRIVELGSFEVGETISVELRLLSDVLYVRQNQDYFCYVDQETFKEYMPQLGESQFNIESYTESKFKGTINMTGDDSLVFTSIAYDEGWKVYLDGEEVELVKLIGGTIGFYAPAGEHKLVMKYRPDCLTLGIALNALGLVLFIGVCIVDHYKRKAHIKAGREVYVPMIEADLHALFTEEKAEAIDIELENELEATPESKENEN